MEPTQVIIRPVVSEKSFVLAEAGKYTFRVHDRAQDADPPGGRGAVRRQGGRGQDRSVKSKPKRRGQTAGRTRQWKKAIVQVATARRSRFCGLQAGE